MDDIKIGDKFKNPRTQLINTVIDIERNHWYPGDCVLGNLYTVRIEGLNRTILLTPALIRRFIKL